MRVWLTRSRPGADRQARELVAAGYEVVVAPVLDIVGTTMEAPSEPADWVIFVSEQAVRHCPDLTFIGGARVFAVGGRTQEVLGRRGIDAIAPVEPTSEGLLALEELAVGRGRTVLIVCGEGGRTLLDDELAVRGARVMRHVCYRRRAVTGVRVDPASVDAIVAASAEGLLAAFAAWRKAGGGVSVPVLVPSARVAAKARELGCRRVVECAGADTRAILSALDRLGADEH